MRIPDKKREAPEKRQKTGRELERMKMLKAYSDAQAQKISERMRELAITRK